MQIRADYTGMLLTVLQRIVTDSYDSYAHLAADLQQITTQAYLEEATRGSGANGTSD